MGTAATTVTYWERKAEEARTKAKEMTSDKSRALMLTIARRCEAVAALTTKKVKSKDK
jgi:hypothetical protein